MRRISQILIVALCLLFASSARSAAAIVDQFQTTFTVFGDLSQSGRSGQTFTAGIDGSLSGVRLVVEGKGFAGPVFGSDFVLSLHSTFNGTPTDTVLATATFSKSSLQRDVPQWVTLTFETPYEQSPGEVLAFTIQELSGGGAEGYNNYGGADGNLYAAGQRFFTFTTGQPLTPSNSDFAFETLVIPEPSIGLLVTFGALSLALLRRRGSAFAL